jgi:anti-sigma B factor antagonist
LRHIEPDIVVVEAAGRIVFGPECQQFEWLVSDLLREGKKRIIFDLSRVSHIDSTGVGIVVLCSGKVTAEGGELRVAGATGLVDRILRISKVHSIVALHPTIAAAVEGFAGSAERDR